MAIIAGGYGLVLVLGRNAPKAAGPLFDLTSKSFGVVGAVLILVLGGLGPITAAWLWWSFSVPKWRLWAMERTDDWEMLEREAISDGLIWDERTLWGWLFSKTEIWSAKDRQRRAEMERSRYVRGQRRARKSN